MERKGCAQTEFLRNVKTARRQLMHTAFHMMWAKTQRFGSSCSGDSKERDFLFHKTPDATHRCHRNASYWPAVSKIGQRRSRYLGALLLPRQFWNKNNKHLTCASSKRERNERRSVRKRKGSLSLANSPHVVGVCLMEVVGALLAYPVLNMRK